MLHNTVTNNKNFLLNCLLGTCMSLSIAAVKKKIVAYRKLITILCLVSLLNFSFRYKNLNPVDASRLHDKSPGRERGLQNAIKSSHIFHVPSISTTPLPSHLGISNRHLHTNSSFASTTWLKRPSTHSHDFHSSFECRSGKRHA